jgi:formylglycine-generating enzyme required for sulfatase activity
MTPMKLHKSAISSFKKTIGLLVLILWFTNCLGLTKTNSKNTGNSSTKSLQTRKLMYPSIRMKIPQPSVLNPSQGKLPFSGDQNNNPGQQKSLSDIFDPVKRDRNLEKLQQLLTQQNQNQPDKKTVNKNSVTPQNIKANPRRTAKSSNPADTRPNTVNTTPATIRTANINPNQTSRVIPVLRSSEPKIYWEQPALGPEMVIVPAGSFQMGNNKILFAKPIHTVVIAKPFAISRYEITFADYDRFALVTGRELPSDDGWGRGKRPVINVSWDDAVAYSQWLSQMTGRSYRLPSEAEWEYAARAGTDSDYWWGNTIGNKHANCEGCGSRWDNKQTAPVGSFMANPFGLYDTASNVFEWVQDIWYASYKQAPADGSSLEQEDEGKYRFHVVRGGSWKHGAGELRSTYRNGSSAVNRFNFIGFRLAQDIE